MPTLSENMAALAQIQKSPLLGFQQQESIRMAPYQRAASQLDLFQKQQDIQNEALDAPLRRQATQQNISASKANVQLKQQEARRQQQLAFGAMADAALKLPEEDRKRFIESTRPIHGLNPGDITDDYLNDLSIAYRSTLAPSTKVGRFKQSVVGGKLVTIDSITGQQKVMDLSPEMPAPESFTDEQKKQWESLSPDGRQKIIEKNLDPSSQIKIKEKLTQTKKKEQFKKIGIGLVDKILSSKELPNVLGPLEGAIDFRLEGSEAELIADIKELESILTGENLDLMTGVLSESDIAMLRQIGAGGLSRMRGVPEFRRRIEAIKNSLGGIGNLNSQEEKQAELDRLSEKYNL